VVAWLTNYALHEDFGGVFGVMEDDNLTARGEVEGSFVAESPFEQGLGVAEFGNNEVIGVVESWDHAGAEYVEGLKDEVVQDQYDRNGENDPRKDRAYQTSEAASNGAEGGRLFGLGRGRFRGFGREDAWQLVGRRGRFGARRWSVERVLLGLRGLAW